MENKDLERFFQAKGEYLQSYPVKTIHSRFSGAIPSNSLEPILKTENKPFSLNDSVKCDFPKGGALPGTTIKWDDGTYDDVKKQLMKQGEEQYLPVDFLPQKLNVKKPSQEELLTDLLVQKRLEKELDIRTGLELFGLSPSEIEDALSKRRVEEALKAVEKPSALRREDGLRTVIRQMVETRRAEPEVETRRAEPEPEVEPETRRAEPEPEPEMEEQSEPAMPVKRRGRKQLDFPSAKTLANNPARVFELARQYGISLTKRGGGNKSITELSGEIVSKYPEGVRQTR